MTLREFLDEYVAPSEEVILVFDTDGHEISNQAAEHLYFLRDRLLSKRVSCIAVEDGTLKVWCE